MRLVAALLGFLAMAVGVPLAIVLDQAHQQHVAGLFGKGNAGACAQPRGKDACQPQTPAPGGTVAPRSSLFTFAPAQPVLPASPSSSPQAATPSGTVVSAAVPPVTPGPSAVTLPGAAVALRGATVASGGTAVAPGGTAVTPDGIPVAQVGPLVLNDSGTDLWNTWDRTSPLEGADCKTFGTVALSSADLALTTNGQFGNCARIIGDAKYKYGTFEARIWVQADADGVIANWPAFYLNGPNWPLGGEIDAFEGMGGYDAASFHYGADDSSLTKQDQALKPGWNIVDVVWKPRLLAVYYNGQKFVSGTRR